MCFQLLRLALLQAQGMFTWRKLLLPGLHLRLCSKGYCLHDAINDSGKVSSRPLNLLVAALVAEDRRVGIILVALGFRFDGELGHLLGAFFIALRRSFQLAISRSGACRQRSADETYVYFRLASTADVENQRVLGNLVVELAVLAIANAASVEAAQADVETFRIVLSSVSFEPEPAWKL